MAVTGHALEHIPQTWHFWLSISTLQVSASRFIASKGHIE
jgi:hypothetical protein